MVPCQVCGNYFLTGESWKHRYFPVSLSGREKGSVHGEMGKRDALGTVRVEGERESGRVRQHNERKRVRKGSYVSFRTMEREGL